MEKEILIFGHKNPDTDSICSSLVKERLNKKLGKENCKAVRLGKVNKETKYVLDYLKLEDSNIKINFSDGSIKFFDNFSNYINTLIKINRDSEFTSKQQKDFMYTLESFNDDITYLNEDLTLAINKVREDKRDFQGIIDDIYNKEETFNNLKQKATFLSIPEGCMEIYESLNEYLNTYSIYLNTIKEAVIYEKTSSNVDEASEQINKNYKNSTSKRNDVLKAYASYENKIKNF